MPFQPSQMFVGEARSLPKSGAPERDLTQVGSVLTQNIKLDWKGLPGTIAQAVTYGRKKFYNIGHN